MINPSVINSQGSKAVWQMTVTNGPTLNNNVHVQFTLPEGWSIDDITIFKGTYNSNTWAIGQMTPNESQKIVVVVNLDTAPPENQKLFDFKAEVFGLDTSSENNEVIDQISYVKLLAPTNPEIKGKLCDVNDNVIFVWTEGEQISYTSTDGTAYTGDILALKECCCSGGADVNLSQDVTDGSLSNGEEVFAQITSSDVDNILTTGSDGGSFLDEETITALIPSTPDPCTTSISFDLKVFLEGAYVNGQSEMRQDLVSIIPSNSPYSNAAPFYNTTRADLTNKHAVDWILIKLRTTSNDASSTVFTCPALVLKDGSVVFDEKTLCNEVHNLDLTGATSYYITVQHRNHIGVESHVAVAYASGKFTYDFTAQDAGLGGGPFGVAQKQMADNNWTLFAANVLQNSSNYKAINSTDEQAITNATGKTGYLNEDANMDGEVGSADSSLFTSNQNLSGASNF